MAVQIDVQGRSFSFGLDWTNWRWHSLPEAPEADSSLITDVNGNRYELYSDGTFAEANRETKGCLTSFLARHVADGPERPSYRIHHYLHCEPLRERASFPVWNP